MKLSLFSLTAVIAVIVAMPMASAQTPETIAEETPVVTDEEAAPYDVNVVDLPEAGVLLDSPFYFLKKWREGAVTFFAFTAEKKARRYRALAEYRLSEAQALIEKGDTERAEQVVARYQKRMRQAVERAEEAQENGRDVDEILSSISERSVRHQNVLIRVLEKVPEKARPAIRRAIENNVQNYERTTERISDDTQRESVFRKLVPNIEEAEERFRKLREQGVEVPSVVIRNVEQIREQIQTRPDLNDRFIKARETRERNLLCAQVVISARNIETGETKDFPTPCDVPEGWTPVRPTQDELNALNPQNQPFGKSEANKEDEESDSTPKGYIRNLFQN